MLAWIATGVLALLPAVSPTHDECPLSAANASTLSAAEIDRDQIDDAIGLAECGPALDTLEQNLRYQIPFDRDGLDREARTRVQYADVLLFKIGADRLQKEIDARDIGAARLRIARMLADERRPAGLAGIESRPTERLRLLALVLGGGDPPALVPDPVPADWRGNVYATCGNVGRSFDKFADDLPDVVDALAATGRPLAALERLLDEDWQDVMVSELGVERMRGLGEAAYGKPGYRHELDLAYASVRIDQRPEGRYAAIPLFGRWRPLPVGPMSKEPADYYTIDELRGQARQSLERHRVFLDRVID
jgi:hypothetical protein